MCGFNNFDKERTLTADFVSSLNGYNSYQLFQSHFARSKQWDILSQMQYVDFQTYLPDDIEVKIDRTSMFHSLELRVPFLDHLVFELVSRLPRSLKVRHGQGKYLLRKVMQPILPPQILSRAKKGFGVPLKHWLGGEFGKFAEEVFRDPVTRQRGILDVSELLSLLRDDRRGRRDQSKRIWAALVFELWCREYLDTSQPRLSTHHSTR
jgi:asparagine synthase (glutamine-hydrolysing)